MTAHHAIVAERSDISSLSIVCSDCGTAVVFDVDTAPSLENGKPEGFFCQACQKDFSPQVREAVSAYARFHRLARIVEKAAQKPVFRIEVTIDAAAPPTVPESKPKSK